VSPRAERIVHDASKACDAQPDRINTSGVDVKNDELFERRKDLALSKVPLI
jgi:hypothetical protein